MIEEKKLVIYGASVSAQSKEDSFWQRLKSWQYEQAKNKNGCWSIERLTFPSAFMSDAALLNLDHVIAMNPDVVVLDWLSTEEQNCSFEKIYHIYEELCGRGIDVITLAAVRLDTWENVTLQYELCLKLSKFLKQSFLDIKVLAEQKGLSWKDLTRDGVHTSEVGAGIISEAIIQEIYERDIGNANYICRDVSDSALAIPQVRQTISHVEIGKEVRVEDKQHLILKLHKNAGKSAQVWCLQTVGPYTPKVECSIEGRVSEIVLFDQWCKFERFAFKPLSPELSSDRAGEFEVSLTLTESVLDESLLKQKIEQSAYCKGVMLRIHDRISLVNCTLKGWEVV